MTLTIDLSPAEEARLEAAARQKGLQPTAIIKELLTEHLPPATPAEDPMLALFARWDEEDAQMTPQEIAEENRSWEQFKDNVNAERDRTGARRVF